MTEEIQFQVDGRQVSVPDDSSTLLEVLRDRLHLRSAKDGCSPQGQCGCCTVLVDGSPRVSCVTPARRVAGRDITTVDGLDRAQQWADAFCDVGASQCGFCTPGIIVRLDAVIGDASEVRARPRVERALAAHLCRCTGWQTILEAVDHFAERGASPSRADRDLQAAAQRATLEGHNPQRVDPEVALGRAGFADDTAPSDALVAVPDGSGGWAVGETLAEARERAGKVQGRRTTTDPQPPLAVPDGDWVLTLQTCWVEPGYLETDAAWCRPGGVPASPLANGGAFGAKVHSPAPAASRELADRHGRAVRVLLSREDVVTSGPKRPPVAAGLRADGSGVLRVVRTPGIAEAIASVVPGLEVLEVDVAGPPTSVAIRGAGWVEALVLLAALASGTRPGDPVRSAAAEIMSVDGAAARAEVSADGRDIRVSVRCGDPLDVVVLRSYCIGAAHQALGWVTSEGLAVDDDGRVHDLTIRSFGILRAADSPRVTVQIEPSDGPPVNGSDAVFAAVATASWIARGLPPVWPCGTGPQGRR